MISVESYLVECVALSQQDRSIIYEHGAFVSPEYTIVWVLHLNDKCKQV